MGSPRPERPGSGRSRCQADAGGVGFFSGDSAEPDRAVSCRRKSCTAMVFWPDLRGSCRPLAWDLLEGGRGAVGWRPLQWPDKLLGTGTPAVGGTDPSGSAPPLAFQRSGRVRRPVSHSGPLLPQEPPNHEPHSRPPVLPHLVLAGRRPPPSFGLHARGAARRHRHHRHPRRPPASRRPGRPRGRPKHVVQKPAQAARHRLPVDQRCEARPAASRLAVEPGSDHIRRQRLPRCHRFHRLHLAAPLHRAGESLRSRQPHRLHAGAGGAGSGHDLCRVDPVLPLPLGDVEPRRDGGHHQRRRE